ncbi:hypothetical protein [Gaiella sp.]|uniref:hypothetical protein n=1 Tax=Gaiella sp. TaxID=2663207 RepID=UPI00326627BD
MSKMSKKLDDQLAAKAKKQKMILIGGAVLLVAVAAFQVPKLMSGGAQVEAVPAATDGSGSTPTAPTTPASGTVTGTATPTAVTIKSVGSVAGVPLPAGPAVVAASDQLVSFTLFEAKDPFVPQEEVSSGSPADTSPPAVASPGADGKAAPPAPSSSPPAAPKAALNSATIKIGGKPQQVAVKGKFPTDEPAFVLVSVAKKSARIAVSGGSFASGETITLTIGKKIVLVNTATNVRYELLLVRTENAATFASEEPAAGTTADPAAAATTTKNP